MCGIAGIIATEGGAPSSDSLRRMADAMRHRGPDADGFWQDGPAALGHRRLSIIDLSEAGRQPLSNEDGTRLDHLQRRDLQLPASCAHELEALGHRFRTRTRHRGDRPRLRAVGHGLRRAGCAGCSPSRSGTRRRRRLFLARDRVGKKPLFYTAAGGTGSSSPRSCRALLADPAVAARGRPARRSTPTSPGATFPRRGPAFRGIRSCRRPTG